ncbi:hypothetical protein B1812_17475 [Methylocystis bryophila]|uniref:Uncharacterized protein n=2 Tax=Methylocystis bryophila TaxID=655015 RepID=A0A1W6MYB7_9HYPH|nr:hypothetical protein B1812_17475 [Methylocystis bryophila]
MQSIKELSSLVNRCLCTLVFAAVILYSALNIQPIVSYLADRFDSLHELKLAGADLTFDAQDIRAAERLFDIDQNDLTSETSRKIARDIRQLNAPLMKRLIFVESLKDLCKYDTQDWKAEEAATLDDRLHDLKLATIEDDPETKSRVDWRIRTGDKYAPAKQLGAPLRCYKVILTAEGANVRDVLVSKMVAAVTARTASEPAAPDDGLDAAAKPAPAVTISKAQHAAGAKVAMHPR